MNGRIDYWSASFCQSCHVLKPKVIKLAAKHGFEFVEHDVEVELDEAVGRHILGVPTLFIQAPDALFPAVVTSGMATIPQIRKAMGV